MFGIASFRGGINPPSGKEQTINQSTELLPPPPYVVIYMLQHAGSPALPVVKAGDSVRVGQLIGEQSGHICSAVHSSVSGKVTDIKRFPHPSGMLLTAVKIENDNSREIQYMPALEKPWKEAAPGELIQIISNAGIVGMEGKAFPTHIKLSPPANKIIDTLIINCIEDEPFITSDSRLLIEKTEEVLTGALIAKKILGTKTVILAIESAKHGIGEIISETVKDPKYKDIKLTGLKKKYPLGSEKILVMALLKKQAPSGGTLHDCGCVVLNAGTVYAIWNALCNNLPLYERIITVAGPAVRSPKNLLVPIGTPLKYILDYCNINMAETKKIVMGGAMTGSAQSDLNVSVQKSTAGIVAFNSLVEGSKRYNCINCGNCVKVCPIRLIPSSLAKYVGKNNIEEARNCGIMDCIECGSCAYVCPAKINLVHYMKLGKYRITGEYTDNFQKKETMQP
ncbi:MAG TPA: electron transport complex subunit RsxC [Fibrobacteres bacterium]|nr:electron transport complex subunit RsxC [Fibrobacterota bacterium]